MKHNTTTFTLFIMALMMGFSLQAQVLSTSGDGRVQTTAPTSSPGTQMGVDVTPGDHVEKEVIVRFDVAPTDRVHVASLLKDNDIFAEEWSPSGKFLRASAPYLVACDYDGNGNPDSDNSTQGDQISLNYYANVTGRWDDSRLYDECLPPWAFPFADPTDIDSGNGDTPASNGAHNYNPAFWCADDATLIPTTGKSKVKMAIIDSGLQFPGQGVSNGVAYTQTAIRDICPDGDCSPIRDGIDAISGGFHPHGSYIFDLVSRWFNSEGLADQLSVSSYQVLNQELKGTIFQVIKAIELAAQEKIKPQIISLSLGFRPLQCGDMPDAVGGFGLDDEEPLNSPLYYAIEAAEAQNIIVITSAGNDNRSLDRFPQFPAAEPGLENLVTVGGLKCGSNQRSVWSNYSARHVDLFSPGSGVKVLENGCYISISGTSFSCPIVAAKAAFHVTAQETYDDKEVLCLLRSQATPFAGAQYGIVDVNANPQACVKEGKKFQKKPVLATSTTVISPNPFNGQLTITQSLPSNESTAVLTLINGQGQEVLRRETKAPTTTLEVGGLIPGVYWLSIHTPSGVETRKVIKR